MFAAKRHLDDNALVRRYLAERGLEVLETADEPLLKHLAHCTPCGERYADLCGLLDEGRDIAVERADAAFTADRLAHQRDRIMRRIEAQNGARVLAFPAAPKIERVTAHSRPMMRWIAAAAVAGIMIGITAGRFMTFGGGDHSNRSASTNIASSNTGAAHAAPVLRAAAGTSQRWDDDQLLSEIDGALAEPRTPELTPIYALTLMRQNSSTAVNVKY